MVENIEEDGTEIVITVPKYVEMVKIEGIDKRHTFRNDKYRNNLAKQMKINNNLVRAVGPVRSFRLEIFRI